MDNLKQYQYPKKRKRAKIKKKRIVFLCLVIILCFFIGIGVKYATSGSDLQSDKAWTQQLTLDRDERTNLLLATVDSNGLLKHLLVISKHGENGDFGALLLPGETYLDSPDRDENHFKNLFTWGSYDDLILEVEDHLDISIHEFVKVDVSLLNMLTSEFDLKEVTHEDLPSFAIDNPKISLEEQRKFIVEFYHYLHDNIGFWEKPKAREIVSSKVDTSLTWDKTEEYQELFHNISIDDAVVDVFPGDKQEMSGDIFWVPEVDKIEPVVNQVFKGEIPEVPKEEITVEVLNGSGVNGAASKLGDRLSDTGFQVDRIGNAEKSHNTSKVITRTDSFDAGKQVAMEISGADLISEVKEDYDVLVTVIIGKNYD